MCNDAEGVVVCRIIEVGAQFRPEVLVETLFSQLLRKLFSWKKPVLAWYGIGGFGYTTTVKDMCKLTTPERAVELIKSKTGSQNLKSVS